MSQPLAAAEAQDLDPECRLQILWSSTWMPDWSCGVAEQASEDPEIAAAQGLSGCLLLPGVLSAVGSPENVCGHLLSAPFIRRWQGFRRVVQGEELVASVISSATQVRTEFRTASGDVAAVEEIVRAEPESDPALSSARPSLYRFGPFARERGRALASGVASVWDGSTATRWDDMPAELVDAAARVVLPTLLGVRATFGFRTPPAALTVISRVSGVVPTDAVLEVHRGDRSHELLVAGSPGGTVAIVEVDAT